MNVSLIDIIFPNPTQSPTIITSNPTLIPTVKLRIEYNLK